MLSPCLGIVWQGASQHHANQGEQSLLAVKQCDNQWSSAGVQALFTQRCDCIGLMQMHAQTLCLCICTGTCTLKPFVQPLPFLVVCCVWYFSRKYSNLFCTDFNETLSESCPKKFSKVLTYIGSVNLSGPEIRENNSMDTVSQIKNDI